MSPKDWAVRAALATTFLVVALSVYLAVIGLPDSETAVTCTSNSPCTETSQVTTALVPLFAAGIPLLLSLVTAVGLIVRRMFLAWAAAIPLLVFSIITGFSFGLLLLPFDVMLIGFLAIIQGREPSL